jgi:O-antigen ligase
VEATESREQLELRSIVVPAVPLFLAILVGGAVTASIGSMIPLFISGLVMGVAILFIDVVHIKRVLLAIVILEIPLQFDVFVGNDPTAVTQISGFNLSVTTFSLVILYAFWAAELVAGHARISQRFRTVVIPPAVYFSLVVMSVLVSEGAVIALYEINILFQALLLLIYVVHFVRTRQEVLLVVVLLLVGLSFQTFLAAAQQLTGQPFELGPIKGRIIGGRSTGTLQHPNRLGAYASLLLGPALGLMMAGRVSRGYRIFGGTSFLLGMLALLLSGSRGATIGAALSLVVAIVVALRKGWLSTRAVLVGGLFVALILFSQLDLVSGRLERGIGGDPNVVGRFRLIELAVAMIRENPLLGVGANHFMLALPGVLNVDFTGAWLATVHHKYLLVWVETGLVGLIAFVYFLFSIGQRAWRVFKFEDAFLSPLALGLLASLMAQLIHMNFDKFAARVDVHMLWMFAGLVYAMYRVAMSSPLQMSTSEPPAEART